MKKVTNSFKINYFIIIAYYIFPFISFGQGYTPESESYIWNIQLKKNYKIKHIILVSKKDTICITNGKLNLKRDNEYNLYVNFKRKKVRRYHISKSDYFISGVKTVAIELTNDFKKNTRKKKYTDYYLSAGGIGAATFSERVKYSDFKELQICNH